MSSFEKAVFESIFRPYDKFLQFIKLFNQKRFGDDIGRYQETEQGAVMRDRVVFSRNRLGRPHIAFARFTAEAIGSLAVAFYPCGPFIIWIDKNMDR